MLSNKGRPFRPQFGIHKHLRAFRCGATRLRTRAAMQTPFVPAIVTPFREDTLEIDQNNFKKYLKFLWDSGIKDIVVNGSTGEFPSMTLDERELIAEIARENWPGRTVVNVSSCNVKDSLRLLKHAHGSTPQGKSLGDGILILPPYYFAASTSEGIEDYFNAVIKESELPVYLYNFPANVNALISPELYSKLGEKFQQLQGIKNTFDDLPLSKKFKDALPDKQVYVGHDPSVLECLEQGFDGAIAATGSVAPLQLLALGDAHKSGNGKAAQDNLDKLNQWNKKVADLGVNIFAAVKIALSYHIPGFPVAVRPPLHGATKQQTDDLLAVLKSIS